MKTRIIVVVALAIIFCAGAQAQVAQDVFVLDLIPTFTANAIEVSNDTVAIVGNAGRIAGSKSNGNSFVFINTPYTEDFLCIAQGGDKLWLGGRNGQMASVKDLSGLNPVASMTAEDIRDLFFVDDQKGWIVGTNGLIKHTVDGLNWTEQVSTVPIPLNGIAQIRGDTLIAVGEFHPLLGGVIIKTVDGGMSWHNLPSGVGKNLTSVCAMGDTIYVGGDSVMVKATDGGSTFWYELPYQFAGTVRSVDGFSPSDIWAGGDFGLCNSTDGGESWAYVDAVDDTVRDVVCQGDFVYAVSANKFYRILVKNRPPEITSVNAVATTVGELLTYEATATDPDGDAVAFSFCDYPGWMAPAGSTISGTPTAAGETSFMVIASDGEYSDSLVVAVTVNPAPFVNTPPTITSPDFATATENVLFAYAATAEDPDGDSLSFSFCDYPGWMAPGDSSIKGTPPSGAQDTSFVLIASDGTDSDTLLVTVTVEPAQVTNTAPRITSPDSTSAQIGESFEYVAAGEDQEGDRLTFHFEGYPSWLTPNGAVLSCEEVPAEAADTSFLVIVSDGELEDTLLVRVTIRQQSAVARQGEIPESFALLQNYPNPFNPSTTIRYSIPRAEHVRVEVFNMAGQSIATLVDEQQMPGSYSVKFFGEVTGVYFYRIATDEFSSTRKMLLVK